MIFLKQIVELSDMFYYLAIQRELSDMRSVLDVGCGSESPLVKIKKTFHSVGLDVHKPSIQKSKKSKIHDEYIIGDVLSLSKHFKKKSFDAVIALDIIEHLSKEDGLKLLNQMEAIAKRKVIIVTPYGFTVQHPPEDNPFQEHKSGWYIEEFQERGYRVFGTRGFRFIRGEYATIKYKPWIIWGAIAALSQFVVYFIPQLAYQLLAVKEMNNK